VGSGKPTDRSPLFDVPHLPDIAYSAPYLHDGSARSLEEIWTVFNPKDTHGVTNDLTKDELNDLIEYLQTL
jgi:cytochrome c peroxidase